MCYQLKLWDNKRERKLTSPNTPLAVHRTKGLSKSREELAGCRLAQPSGGRRRVEGKGAGSAPRTALPTTLQTGLQFLTKDFLRFWMVNIHQEGRDETQGTCTQPAWAGTGAGDAEGRRSTHPTGVGRN